MLERIQCTLAERMFFDECVGCHTLTLHGLPQRIVGNHNRTSVLAGYLDYWPSELIGLQSKLGEMSAEIHPIVDQLFAPFGLQCKLFSVVNLDINKEKYHQLDKPILEKTRLDIDVGIVPYGVGVELRGMQNKILSKRSSFFQNPVLYYIRNRMTQK